MRHVKRMRTIRPALSPPTTCWIAACAVLCLAGDVCAQDAFAKAASAQAIEGFSQPFRIAKLAASTSGVLETRHVAEGQPVKQGEAILSLNASVAERALEIARAAVEAKGELAAAEAEYSLRKERLLAVRKLTTRGHATDDELRRTQAEYNLAAAALQTVNERRLIRELECAKLEAELAAYCVRAPFDGVVTKFHKIEGEFVGPGDVAVCTLAELTALSAEFLMPREAARRFRLGRSAKVHFLESERQAVGNVCYVSPFPEGETGMYFVRVRIDNRAGSFSAGQRCLLAPAEESSMERQAAGGPQLRPRKGPRLQ